MRRTFVQELLSLLEHREARALTWGFYDGGFDVQEVERLLGTDAPERVREMWKALERDGVNLVRLLDDMAHAGLLYRPHESQTLLRTRFAETTRLLARLRQYFRQQDWATGPALVRDIRIDLKPRRYPKRNVAPADAWSNIATSCAVTELQRRCFEALSVDAAGKTTPFAGFQARAFSRILSHYGDSKDFRGTVVSAGTGSGKTKAFYVPALLGIVADIAKQPSPFTKVLAIYPRNVLLADQFREAAAEVQRLNPVLASAGHRGITVGAYLGDTPPEAAFGQCQSIFLRNWRRVAGGWVVPFLRSPRDGKSDLVWRDEDRLAGRTPLYQRGAIGDSDPVVPSGLVQLTREGLQRAPPDVLFLSLEMLNREIGNPLWAQALGIANVRGQPRLLLLDEAHSYEGLAGAQLPWILRRWVVAGRLQSLHIVGLSATLRNAKSHLEALTGIVPSRIDEISPVEDTDGKTSEVLSEGIEYGLAIRGKTEAGAQLLATSIQAAMLLARVLTPDNQAGPAADDEIEGSFYYARKVFGFTDNLDVLNRWLADLTDADNRRMLAALRVATSSGSARSPAEYRDGQVWELSELLGHNLRQSVLIDRCSSQDPNLNPRARIVLATSSLEVGYDDQEVGIILQHKAPITMASFIQRKGRAGRRRGTRPMTVVVLSDFGRDKWAFRDSHRLFGNAIEQIRVPALNPYVLKIQGALFLIDWIGRSIGRPQPFKYLSEASDEIARDHARQLLTSILDGGVHWSRFQLEFREWLVPYIQATRVAVDVDRVLEGILWDAPRPLLRHVIPALLKHLERPGEASQEWGRARRPIPEYIPGSTFAELDARDIRVTFSGQRDRQESLAASRFLTEFCPGRVSKRFAVGRREVGYWPIVSATLAGTPDQQVTVDSICSEAVLIRSIDDVDIYEPLALELDQRPQSIKDSSHGTWNLELFTESVGAGVDVALLQNGCWKEFFRARRAHLHRDHDGVRILRFARSGRYEILGPRDQVVRGRFQLAARDEESGAISPQGIGVERQCDALVLEVDSTAKARLTTLSSETMERLRADVFLDRLLSCEVLVARANTFAIGYLWQTSLAMLTATALRQRCSLQNAQEMLRGQRVTAVEKVVGRLLGGLDDDDNHGGQDQPRRLQQIVDMWSDPDVLRVIEDAEKTLWEPMGSEIERWLWRRLLHTVASALRVAATSVLSDVPESDLAVDVVETGDRCEILLSETTGGGLGHIEALLAVLAAEPNHLDKALRACLTQCPRSRTASNVLETLAQSRRGFGREPLATAFRQARRSRTLGEIDGAKTSLRDALALCGLDGSRDAVVDLMATILRPGSTAATDRWMGGLNAHWRRKSRDLGISVPSTVFSYCATKSGGVSRRFGRTLASITGSSPSDQQVFLGIEALLHEGCEDSCSECLGTGRPEDTGTKPSRSVVMQCLGMVHDVAPLEYGSPGWEQKARAALRTSGRTTLKIDGGEMARAAADLNSLLAAPVETEYLLLSASIGDVRRQGRGWLITFQVRGVADAG